MLAAFGIGTSLVKSNRKFMHVEEIPSQKSDSNLILITEAWWCELRSKELD